MNDMCASLLKAVIGATETSPVGSGRLQGGWEYVWSSYAIAWGAMALYALSLWRRKPLAPPEGTGPSTGNKESQ